MKTFIVGQGEIGTGLRKVLSQEYEIQTYDIKDGQFNHAPRGTEIVHICIPYCNGFQEQVDRYTWGSGMRIKNVVVHSSVPVGTCEQLGALHSPVRGKHPDIAKGIASYVKYIGYDNEETHRKAKNVSYYFERAGIRSKLIDSTRKTELMKLLELCRYGVYLAFAKEQEEICQHFGLDYQDVVTEYDRTRNDGLEEVGLPDYRFPLLTPFRDYVGGHCTVEDMEILLNQKEFGLLRQAYDIDRQTKIWGNCNIYKTAKIGKGCSIGQFTEIGERVKIGNRVRIGAMCFLPEGVEIEDDVFIAPRVSFSNDKHPPSRRSEWGKILIKKGAMIGMGSVILPGVTVGENAVIGAGSVVAKDVGDGTVWYGQAASQHGLRKDVYSVYE